MLAPDIRDSFGVSDGVIVFITAASSAFLVLGVAADGVAGRPHAAPADHRRGHGVFGVSVFLSGLAINAFTLFLARFGVGMAKSATTTVHGR